MPFEVTWADRGYYKRVFGEVSASDFFQSIAKIQNHPDFDRLRFGINDFLGVTSVDIKPSDIDLYAAANIGAALSNPRMRIAIVATDERIIGMVKAFTSVAPYPTLFFDTPEEAHAWVHSLGLESTVQ